MGNHGYADYIRRRHLKEKKAKEADEWQPMREEIRKRREAMKYSSVEKSRFDRYVCAVASGEYSRHPDLVQGSEIIAMNALLLMLAADKRWEEYTKGETP